MLRWLAFRRFSMQPVLAHSIDAAYSSFCACRCFLYINDNANIRNTFGCSKTFPKNLWVVQ